MTKSGETTELDTETFWEARDAHQDLVATKLEEALQIITDPTINLKLYRDGVTVKLENVRLALLHHITQLRPPIMPSGPTMPVPIPPAN